MFGRRRRFNAVGTTRGFTICCKVYLLLCSLQLYDNRLSIVSVLPQ